MNLYKKKNFQNFVGIVFRKKSIKFIFLKTILMILSYFQFTLPLYFPKNLAYPYVGNIKFIFGIIFDRNIISI